jgi:hypothetical protein
MLKDSQLYHCQNEARDLFWDLSVELVDANRHGQEGCKLHHHFVWTDTDNEDDEQPRGLTVRMIRSPMELPGAPAPRDIEEEGGAREEPRPSRRTRSSGTTGTTTLDARRGCQYRSRGGPRARRGRTHGPAHRPRPSRLGALERGTRDEASNEVQVQWTGGTLTRGPFSRGACGDSHIARQAGKGPKGILREVKRSVLNLRLEYRENVERALKDNLAMQEEREQENSEGIPLETRLDAFELTPTAEPQDYLVDDDEVVAYLFKGKLPVFANLSTKKRKEARRQIQDRAKKFRIDNGRLFFLDKPSKRPNQVPGVTQKKAVLTRMEKEAVLRSVHDNGGHPSMSNTRKLKRDRFWWAGMYNQIGDCVRSCHN